MLRKRPVPISLAVLLSLVVLFSLLPACKSKYPNQPMTLLWEATVPSGRAVVACGNDGAADVVPSAVGDVVPAMMHFDVNGRVVSELRWVSVPHVNFLQRGLPTKYGWVACEIELLPPGGDFKGDYSLASSVKLVTREGRVVWDMPGLANARVLYVDDSFVVCRGKDPAVLASLPSRENQPAHEYNETVATRLDAIPWRILILRTETGARASEFDVPAGLEPKFGFRSDLSPDSVVVHCEKNEIVERTDVLYGNWILCRNVAWFDSANGQNILTIDLRSALPDSDVQYVVPWQRGVLAVDTENRVAALDADSHMLFRSSPKGALANSFTSIGTEVRPDDPILLLFVSPVGTPDAPPRLDIWTKEGKPLEEMGGISAVSRAADAKRAAAVGNDSFASSRASLYLIDFEAGSLKIALAKVPPFSACFLSPSGEHVAFVRPLSDAECKVAVYRLGSER